MFSHCWSFAYWRKKFSLLKPVYHFKLGYESKNEGSEFFWFINIYYFQCEPDGSCGFCYGQSKSKVEDHIVHNFGWYRRHPNFCSRCSESPTGHMILRVNQTLVNQMRLEQRKQKIGYRRYQPKFHQNCK